ncbi:MULTISPECIES: hypothetical protein [Sorangium]|uniref:Uncharacterized protein n=1 Tax=Sorangium cellulosum TaxID=56 RepID=A0A3S7UWB6_SORCE|nr:MULTISPECIES: hypothetical protein [Sorangium]AUX30546.1 uncharacterized protein SOCE836_026550 [Sorangium cellulosum]AYM53027.1 hypothetical protein [Sorangium cellulosum]WCQ89941.1 hypothetical protein NQZ70_02639 [Sorangium sp. Soce836]
MSGFMDSVRIDMLAALVGIGISATMSGCAAERPEQLEEGEELVGTAEGAARRTSELKAELTMPDECLATWPGATPPTGKATFRFITDTSRRNFAQLVTLNDLHVLPNMRLTFTKGDIRKGTPGEASPTEPPMLVGSLSEATDGPAVGEPPGTFIADAAGDGRIGFGYSMTEAATMSLKALATQVKYEPDKHYIDLRTDTCPNGFMRGTFRYPTEADYPGGF